MTVSLLPWKKIDGYNVKLDKAYTKMMSGNYDYASASKEDKLDVTGLIINPSFKNGLMMQLRLNGKTLHLQMVGRLPVVQLRVD